MKLAVISLSNEGTRLAARLAAAWPECDVFLHAGVTEPFLPQTGEGSAVTRFDKIVELTAEIFHSYRGLVYVAPTGVVVRAIAPCIGHKTTDPAVVAVDVG